MKKIAYSFAILLAAVACTKEMSVEKPGQNGAITFVATSENSELMTRTSLDENKNIVWDEGDAIAVFNFDATNGATKATCTLQEGAGTAIAKFTGDITKSTTGYFAVYPDQDNISYNCSSDILSTYPKGNLQAVKKNYSVQYARIGNIPSNVTMIAYADAPADDATKISMDFKNVFAYFKFTIDYKCKSVTIESNNESESLTPSDFSLSFDDNGVPVISDCLSGIKTVTLVNEDGSELRPGTYYVAVLPQTLSNGFKMTFKSSIDETKVTTISTSKSATLKRSSVLNLGTIDLSGIYALEGSGETDTDPYVIKEFLDLKAMSYLVNNNIGNYPSAYFRQQNDIDCEGQTLTPIGGETRFSGNYEGLGYTLSNIVYDQANFDGLIAYGLFGCIKNATISRLNIENPSFILPSATTSYNISPLVGVAIGDDGSNYISYCNIRADKNSTLQIDKCHYLDYGGIVAFNESDIVITRCSSNLNVSVDASTQVGDDHLYVGGLLGYTSGEKSSDPTHGKATDNAYTRMTYCRNTGDISISTIHSKDVAFGGIIGMCHDCTEGDVCAKIAVCVNDAVLYINNFDEVYTDSEGSLCMGGIIGKMDSDGFISLSGDIKPEITACLEKGVLRTTALKYCNASGIAGSVYDRDTKFKYCVNAASDEAITLNFFSEKILGGYSILSLSAETSLGDDDFVSDCYITTSNWADVSCDDTDLCTFKADLTSDDMNNLTSGVATWVGNATDGTLDIDFFYN